MYIYRFFHSIYRVRLCAINQYGKTFEQDLFQQIILILFALNTATD